MSQNVTFEQRSYAGGLNAAALPNSLLRADELSLVVNGVVNGGYLKTRPGWQWKPLSFVDIGAQRIFESGKYQGSGFFMSDYGNVFVYVVDGHVFIVDPKTWFVVKVTDKPAFSEFSPHVWVQQRNRWIIIQDGVSPPFVSDGVTISQEVKPGGVPTGTLMADGWHRLAVVSSDRRRIYFSDHEMSQPPASPITFTETEYFSTARYFEAPPSLGKIVGIQFTPYLDSSTGIGPLLVFCEKGVRAYDISVPRDQWTARDISQTILPHVGACSFFAYSDRGSQLMFRDQEGRIRSIRNAQQLEAAGSNVPNDFAIWPLIENEDSSLRSFSRAVTYDSRVLFLVHPFRKELSDFRYNVAHKAIAVLDSNTPFTDKEDVWSLWTGFDFCGLDVGPVDGQETCLGFSAGGVNRLYALSRDEQFDSAPGKSGSFQRRIMMTFATGHYDFGSASTTKKMTAAGIRLSNMRGEVGVSVRFEKDGEPPVKWFDHVESHPMCAGFLGCEFTAYNPGVKPRLVFPALSDKSANFHKGRVVFDITGHAQVEDMAFVASVSPMATVSNASCKPKSAKATPLCGIDIFAYEAESQEPTPLTTPKSKCPS